MLELIDVCFEVENKKILKNINLKIDSDKFIAITGPNGSGKSTISKIIMGIEKPTSGKIIFKGQDITNLGISERANLGIGFAFQQPVTFKGLTVKDLITIAAKKDLNLHEVCEYLSDVGLCAKEYVNRQLDTSLSGGELKRIEIAMLAAKKSDLTIFDEPEAGIDLWSFNSLINVFEKMHQEIKGTIMVVSHQERILSIADQIILLKAGEVDVVGTSEEVMKNLNAASTARPCKFVKED